MIRHAQPGDTLRLSEIWTEVFGNEENFVEDFFEHAFSGKEALCYVEEGEAVAMLFMLPCQLLSENGKTEKAYYFYALATLEQYRGKGIMGRLIRHAQKEISQEGIRTIFLMPASESLISYYERFGFAQVVCPVTYAFGKDAGERIGAAMEVSVEDASIEEQEAFTLETAWKYTNRNVLFEKRMESFYRRRSRMEEGHFFWKLVRDQKTMGYLEGYQKKEQILIQNYGVDLRSLEEILKRLGKAGQERKISVCSTAVWGQIQGFIPD